MSGPAVEGVGSHAGAGTRPTPRLLEPVDLLLVLVLMGVGLGLRLAWFSGFGLGDDVIFRHGIAHLLTNKTVPVDNQAYRFTWWLPTALACRIFGLGEVPMILPVTAFATLGTGVLYAFGKVLWGRPGGVIAALLLLVAPLDFAWSTMITSDIVFSVFSALTFLFVLRALEQDDQAWRRRQWVLAGVNLWLAYHAKVSAVLLGPPLLIILWRHRRRLDRDVLWFVASAGLLLGGSCLVSYVFTGDPLAPYHAELHYQGLTGPRAVDHRLTSYVFWQYPEWLLRPNRFGNLFFSVYPHLVVALALVGLFLGLRTSADVFWWFLFVFLGLQFNIQRVEGVWISGFRNVRHAHALLYPVILLLTGYLVGLRARWPRFGGALVVLLVGFGAWQSVTTASITKASFADRRLTCRYLATLPPKALYSDFQIFTWCSIVDVQEPAWNFRGLHSFDAEQRKREIAAITSGYLVTGGGREPYYGCIDCIPSASEVTPGRFRLLTEFPGPARPTFWRAEPVRVWEAIEAGG